MWFLPSHLVKNLFRLPVPMIKESQINDRKVNKIEKPWMFEIRNNRNDGNDRVTWRNNKEENNGYVVLKLNIYGSIGKKGVCWGGGVTCPQPFPQQAFEQIFKEDVYGVSSPTIYGSWKASSIYKGRKMDLFLLPSYATSILFFF